MRTILYYSGLVVSVLILLYFTGNLGGVWGLLLVVGFILVLPSFVRSIRR